MISPGAAQAAVRLLKTMISISKNASMGFIFFDKASYLLLYGLQVALQYKLIVLRIDLILISGEFFHQTDGEA